MFGQGIASESWEWGIYATQQLNKTQTSTFKVEKKMVFNSKNERRREGGNLKFH